MKKQTAGFTSEFELLNELVTANQASTSNMEEVVANAKLEQAELINQINELKRAEQALSEKVKDHQEAIESIDAFRRSVNARLAQP